MEFIGIFYTIFLIAFAGPPLLICFLLMLFCYCLLYVFLICAEFIVLNLNSQKPQKYIAK